MKFGLIILTFLSQSGFTMGDPNFLPANPTDAKTAPNFKDLKRTDQDRGRQAQEEKIEKQDKSQKKKNELKKESL